MAWFLAAYDITRNKSRAQAAKLLLRFGQRVQKSVFEVALDAAQLPALRSAMSGLLEEDDRFLLVPLDRRAHAHRIAVPALPPPPGPVVML